MSIADIPDSVRQLIATSIDSIAELEAILLLRGQPERGWSPEEAGQRLYVSTTVAAYTLAVLARRGFFSEQDQRYRYFPITPELGQTVNQLATTYTRHLIQVTHLVHSKPAPSVLQFAEAFRLRKDH